MGLMSSYERKGYMQGLSEGKIEGMTEGKVEVASRMLEEGLSVELIAKVTGLPGPDIEKLKVSH
ncbi:putative transposase/invertase (TIGR01784 family) [Cohnella sp. SGD-V74]|nr:putative transposase/invertase (TIGR01784 family) [Cohnella sp. SGD-V74]